MKKKLAIFLVMLMVLTAVAPSFAATIIKDQPPVDQNAALDELIMLGVLKERRGDDYLKRQDTVVLLSRLMGQEEQAKAYPINHPFNDVSDSFYNGYLGWAYANQYFMGKSDIEFGFGEFMTVQQLQIVLLRSLGYYLGEFPGWDVVASTASSLGFGSSVPGTAIASRGTMATMTTSAIRANYKDTSETLAERLGHDVKMKADNDKLNIVAFRQVDRRTFELECDEAIVDLQDSIIIKRGNITNSIKEITFPTYGKEVARIEMNSNIMDADYTAFITDKKDQQLSMVVRGERPYLADILITSDTAKLKGFTSTDMMSVIVNYETVDQFDNPITGSITWSGSFNSSTDHGSYLELRRSTAWQLGQQVMITGIAQVTGKAPVVVNRMLSVSEPRKAVSLEFGELQNIDKDPEDDYIVQGSTDVWAIPVYAYDQDGELIKDKDYFTDGNIMLSPADGKAVWYYPKESQVAEGKDGKIYVRIYASDFAQTAAPTTLYLNLVDKGSGANATTAIELLPNGVNKFIVEQPDMVIAGTPVEFPFEAYNYVGDSVTKYNTLYGSVTANGQPVTVGEKQGFYWIKKANGDAKLMYKNNNTSATTQFMDYVTFMANNMSPTQVNFIVYPRANPYAIAGVDEEEIFEYYALNPSADASFTRTKLKYEDQYGNEYDGSSFPYGYRIEFSGDGEETSNNTISNVDLGTAGTYTVTATLYKDDTILDEQSFDVTVLEPGDIDSFEVTQIGKVYAPLNADSGTYGKKVEVVGKEGNKEVKLAGNVITDVQAITNTDFLKADPGSKLVWGHNKDGDLKSSTTGQLIVKYNVGGQVFVEQQTVTVSPEEPRAIDVRIKSKDGANYSGGTVYVDSNQVDGRALVLSEEFDPNASYSGYFDAFFEAEDQYGIVSKNVVSYLYVKDNADYAVDNTSSAFEIDVKKSDPEAGDTFTIVCVTAAGTIELTVYVQ